MGLSCFGGGGNNRGRLHTSEHDTPRHDQSLTALVGVPTDIDFRLVNSSTREAALRARKTLGKAGVNLSRCWRSSCDVATMTWNVNRRFGDGKIGGFGEGRRCC